MAPPQLRPNDLLRRAAKKFWLQDGIVASSAYVRRPPSVDGQGRRQEGDATGLSVGFAENESLDEFVERTQRLISFHGVIGVRCSAVRDAGLGIEPARGSEVKGNITRMPYNEATAAMTSPQLDEVNEKRALDLQRQLAEASEILTTGHFGKVAR